jgi:hypothetical protein
MDIFNNLNTLLGIITGLITIITTIIALVRYKKSKDNLSTQIQQATTYVLKNTQHTSGAPHNKFKLSSYQLDKMEDAANDIANSLCSFMGFIIFALNLGWIISIISSNAISLSIFAITVLLILVLTSAVLLPIFLKPSVKFYFLSRAIYDYKKKIQLLDRNDLYYE